MRALGFCVSVEHAHWMARKFGATGLRAAALDASSPRDERADQIRRLRNSELQILFAMDLFNEGLDIPEIDTVLFLRPTESHLVFLQQRWAGPPPNFRFDLRYRALLGGTRDQLKQQIEAGFPLLPAGCSLQLDRVSSERVLANLRESLPSRRPSCSPKPAASAVFPGGPARRAGHGAGGVLPGGGVVGAAAAGAGLGGRGGLRGAQRR